ncbi:MAG TPA: hypothetical protein PK264_08930 [Hyphomicrobiaceae bacterium]|nr:hypothetical protein [Hyphomicrobiaceae bacterium]
MTLMPARGSIDGSGGPTDAVPRAWTRIAIGVYGEPEPLCRALGGLHRFGAGALAIAGTETTLVRFQESKSPSRRVGAALIDGPRDVFGDIGAPTPALSGWIEDWRALDELVAAAVPIGSSGTLATVRASPGIARLLAGMANQNAMTRDRAATDLSSHLVHGRAALAIKAETAAELRQAVQALLATSQFPVETRAMISLG